MSILVNGETRVIIQGLSGFQAQFDTRGSLAYGTRVVGGVVPGRKGEKILDLPIFNTVAEAVATTGADASVIYVPAMGAKDAIIEAAYAGIKLVVIITEKVPVRDFAEAYHISKKRGTRLLGPNCNGIISPGKTKLGILGNAPKYFIPGPVGCLSRSGGMNHEIPNLLTRSGIGQSTCVSIGGDLMIGSTFRECLELFEADPETEVVSLFCEPGGAMEEEVAESVRAGKFSKPLIAYVSGMFMETMPESMPFGHAGALIERGMGRPSEKKRILAEAGVRVVDRLSDIPDVVKSLFE